MIDLDFFKVDNYLKFDDMVLDYNKLFNQNINLLHQINNMDKTIIHQREKIKSLSRQINFLNKAIWRYKHEKNS